MTSISVKTAIVLLWQNSIPESTSQEEQNDTNFSFIARSSGETDRLKLLLPSHMGEG